MEVSTEMLYGSIFLYHYESTQANGVIHRKKLISIRSDGVSPGTRVFVLLSQDLPSLFVVFGFARILLSK